MVWSVLLYSEYLGDAWVHTSATFIFRLFFRVQCKKVVLFSRYFGEEETVLEIPLIGLTARGSLDSVGLFNCNKRVQIKLLSREAAEDVEKTVIYTKSIMYLQKELRKIRKNSHKQLKS